MSWLSASVTLWLELLSQINLEHPGLEGIN
jgi:hypothetical protein